MVYLKLRHGVSLSFTMIIKFLLTLYQTYVILLFAPAHLVVRLAAFFGNYQFLALIIA